MLSELNELINDYKRKLSLRLVVLFGSRARGDYTENSDIDILVVADDLPRDPRETYAILRNTSFPQVNPIGFNKELFIKKLKSGSVFLIEILEDGEILYVDDDFLEHVMSIYREVRNKYIRIGKTWLMKNNTTDTEVDK